MICGAYDFLQGAKASIPSIYGVTVFNALFFISFAASTTPVNVLTIAAFVPFKNHIPISLIRPIGSIFQRLSMLAAAIIIP